jgi:hypothetical protein
LGFRVIFGVIAWSSSNLGILSGAGDSEKLARVTSKPSVASEQPSAGMTENAGA